MNKSEFLALLRRKAAGLAAVVAAACAIAAAMFAVYEAVLWLLPEDVAGRWQSFVGQFFADPRSFRDLLLRKGASAPWFFVGVQVLQVLFAPIPGQAVALAGGFVFGFWKGWALTTLGLALGSLLAMLLARLLGERFVRRLVPDGVMKRFDSLLTKGGYTMFFMIFLLPALPDDAVCFIAGMTKLRLLPLSLVCLLGRAPGMAVLSLLGSELTSGPTAGVKILFMALMVLSIPLWIFWEIIGEKIRALVMKPRRK